MEDIIKMGRRNTCKSSGFLQGPVQGLYTNGITQNFVFSKLYVIRNKHFLVKIWIRIVHKAGNFMVIKTATLFSYFMDC